MLKKFNNFEMQTLPNGFHGFDIICQDIVSKFEEIFGQDEVRKFTCAIHIDNTIDAAGNRKAPELFPFNVKGTEPNAPNFKLRLTIDDYSYWANGIYQLSHELTHLVLQNRADDIFKNAVIWFEETICEAVALYFLEFYGKNWDKRSFCLDNSYGEQITNYLLNKTIKKQQDEYDQCTDQEKIKNIPWESSLANLQHLNSDAKNGEKRVNRFKLTLYLYDLIKKNPKIMRAFLNYKKHIIYPNSLPDFYSKESLTDQNIAIYPVLLDFQKWISEGGEDKHLVEELSKIYPTNLLVMLP